MNFFIAALGCPKNFVEAEIISGSMLSNGASICFDPEDADVYVINTCAFLPAAREEAAEEIAAAVEWKNAAPGRRIVVAGCLMNHADLPGFKKSFKEVDLWVRINDTAKIPELLDGRIKPTLKRKLTYLSDETLPRFMLTLPHVGYLKIADGCNNCCAYCAIPALRGTLRSRPQKSVLKEAEMLIGNGVKELIVIAQDVTAYGLDRPESGETLTTLLTALEALPEKFVIRLLYTHPAHYTDELIAFLARSKKVLPYLDIPLQHISDRILSEMNRHIDRAGTIALLKKLRADIPDLVLRSTFITGLPGETEEEFEDLCSFAEEMKFDRFGVFSYAPEPGTRAASMPDQVPEALAEERAQKLLDAQIARMKRAQRKMIGRSIRVIVDSVDDGTAVCRGAADAPDIDNVVLVPAGRKLKAGNFAEVRITGVSGCDLTGECRTNRKK